MLHPSATAFVPRYVLATLSFAGGQVGGGQLCSVNAGSKVVQLFPQGGT